MRIIIMTQQEHLFLPEALSRVCRAESDAICAIVTAPAMSTHRGPLRGFLRHLRLFGWRDTARLCARIATARLCARLGRSDRQGRPCSMQAVAEEFDIEYHHVPDVNGPEFGALCDRLQPDLLVSMSCPQIIRPATRQRFARGCINVHGSPLPKYRGLMPAFWVLRNGESETAATVHDLVDRLDDGEILQQRRVPIRPTDTWESLVRRTKAVGAAALIDVIGQIRTGSVQRRANPDSQASYYSFPTAADAQVFRSAGRRFLGSGQADASQITTIETFDQDLPGSDGRSTVPQSCLSFDIEDWYHVLDTQAAPPIERWMSLPDRQVRNVDRILEILSARQVRATFFWLGWSASRHPELLRRCIEQGHEIASHGWGHVLAYQVGPVAFAEDIARGKDVIEQIIGQPVRGFRAPGFGIRPETTWALELIRQAGYSYDASIFPAVRGHGGIPGAGMAPSMLQTPSGALAEIPMSVVKILGRRICLFSGGYLRLAPMGMLRRGLRQLRSSQRPLVSLIHPRELDPEGPRLSLPLRRQFKCYVNLHTTQRKLEWLCDQPGQGTMGKLAESLVRQQQRQAPARRAG